MRSLDAAEHDVKSDDVDNLIPTFLLSATGKSLVSLPVAIWAAYVVTDCIPHKK